VTCHKKSALQLLRRLFKHGVDIDTVLERVGGEPTVLSTVFQGEAEPAARIKRLSDQNRLNSFSKKRAATHEDGQVATREGEAGHRKVYRAETDRKIKGHYEIENTFSLSAPQEGTVLAQGSTQKDGSGPASEAC